MNEPSQGIRGAMQTLRSRSPKISPSLRLSRHQPLHIRHTTGQPPSSTARPNPRVASRMLWTTSTPDRARERLGADRSNISLDLGRVADDERRPSSVRLLRPTFFKNSPKMLRTGTIVSTAITVREELTSAAGSILEVPMYVPLCTQRESLQLWKGHDVFKCLKPRMSPGIGDANSQATVGFSASGSVGPNLKGSLRPSLRTKACFAKTERELQRPKLQIKKQVTFKLQSQLPWARNQQGPFQ